MIELLGVGVPSPGHGWLLHRVCTQFMPAQVAAIASRRRQERDALCDVLTGAVIPSEGRLWVNRVPLMRDTRARVRAMVADVRLDVGLARNRSVLWNVLASAAPGGALLQRLLRLPLRVEREAALRTVAALGLGTKLREPAGLLTAADRVRVLTARALTRRPVCLVVRELDDTLDGGDVSAVLESLRALARVERLSVVIAVDEPGVVRGLVDRVVGLADGLLVLDGAESDLDEPLLAHRLRMVRP